MVTFLCPVRQCGLLLENRERSLVCPRGHSFDRARSGYCNLLQPQDKRSLHPGDSRDAVAARRRFLENGHEAPFFGALLEVVKTLSFPERPAVLDVGCGEGSHLAALAAALGAEAHGLDISVPAIDLAARRYPAMSWTVANADRFLPYAPESFHLATSLTARMNPPEMRRVLAPGGRLVVAVPGEEDLVELREAVLGERVLRSRVERTVETFAGDFALESQRLVRWEARLEAGAVRDVLEATYRGGRESRRRTEVGEMVVTMSRDVLVLSLASG